MILQRLGWKQGSVMSCSALLRKKTAFLFLILFLFSLLIIAFDPHPGDCVVSDCPICKAKTSLGTGLQHTVDLDTYKPFSYQYTGDQEPSVTSLLSLVPHASRAPPASC
ncbi:MAG: hypothetical protein ABSC55_17130 [Syntrophorhabdales bacterium]